jgi:hypothetical protein
MLFDDDRKPLGLKEELSVIDEVLNKVRRDLQLDPSEFHLKLVITGLKIVGRHHIMKMIDSIVDGRSLTSLIAGFDMVNEEDVTPPILSFVPDIIQGKMKDH